MTFASAQPQDGARGVDLLLEHCACISRLDESRPPALERLEQLLGRELARMLVVALAGSRALPVRLVA